MFKSFHSSSLVLIHLGETLIPDYTFDNLKILQKLNSKITIYFIANNHNEAFFHFQIKQLNLNIDYLIFIPLEKIPQSELTKDFIINNKYDKTFRKAFWLNTTYRFFVLTDFISYADIENIIHLENDYILFCDPLQIINCCKNLKDFMVPLDINRAIPGIVWIKNSNIANKLIEFILLNYDLNDMVSLGNFVNSNDDSGSFPTLPPEYSTKYNIDHKRFSEFYTDFNALFDAAAIGQFLGGVHRLNDPNDTIFFQNENSHLKLKVNDILWHVINEKNVPHFLYDNKSYRILGLHIHSKNVSTFSPFYSYESSIFSDFWSHQNLISKSNVILTNKDANINSNRCNYNNTIQLDINLKDEFLNINKFNIDFYNNFINIYIFPEVIEYFSIFIAPKITFDFNLFTHDMNFKLSFNNLDLLNSSKLNAWHVLSSDLVHEKIKIIPLGIPDNFNNISIPSYISNLSKNIQKISSIYYNVINSNINDCDFLHFIKSNTNNTINYDGNYFNHLSLLSAHRFCICEASNQNNNYLFWEAQYLNVIPIILKSDWNSAYSNLPLVTLNSWTDLLNIDMSECYLRIRSTHNCLNKLKISTFL